MLCLVWYQVMAETPSLPCASLHRCKGYGPADWRPVLPVRSLQRWKSAPAIRVPGSCRWEVGHTPKISPVLRDANNTPGVAAQYLTDLWKNFQENDLKWELCVENCFCGHWSTCLLFIVCVHLNCDCICMCHATCEYKLDMFANTLPPIHVGQNFAIWR